MKVENRAMLEGKEKGSKSQMRNRKKDTNESIL